MSDNQSETNKLLICESDAPEDCSLNLDTPPLHVLPDELRRYVDRLCVVYSTTPAMVFPLLLAASSAAIGASAHVFVHETWREIASLWVAVVAGIGGRKSPILARIVKPLEEHDQQLYRAWETTMSRWTEGKKGGHGKLVGGLADFDPTVPVCRQLVVKDTTIEALVVILKNNPRGVAVVQDELRALFTSMGAYKRQCGSDREHWLSLHSGARIVVNRKHQRRGTPLAVDNPRVAVFGCTTSSVARELCLEKGNDGLIERFSWITPPRTRSNMTGGTLDELSWQSAIHNLTRLPVGDRSRAVAFSSQARGLMAEVVDGIENYIVPPQAAYMQGVFGKRCGLTARISLVLALLGDPATKVVTSKTLKHAIAVENWLFAHTLHHLSDHVDPLDRLPLTKLARRIHRLGPSTIPDARRRLSVTSSELREAMAELMDIGLLEEVNGYLTPFTADHLVNIGAIRSMVGDCDDDSPFEQDTAADAERNAGDDDMDDWS